MAPHVARTSTTVGCKVCEYHYLRSSYHDRGKVKHRTYANLSHLPAHVIDLLRRALAGEELVPASALCTPLSFRSYLPGYESRGMSSNGYMGRRIFLKSKRRKLGLVRPGASTSMVSAAMGSKAAR